MTRAFPGGFEFTVHDHCGQRIVDGREFCAAVLEQIVLSTRIRWSEVEVEEDLRYVTGFDITSRESR